MSGETNSGFDGLSDRPEGEREEETMALLKRATGGLMEHFDTVQVFVTRNNGPDEVTMTGNWGGGNWYARYGQIREWLIKQETRAKENIKREDSEET